MIYACIRFIQEWAHPLTIVNYVLIGLSSGLVLASALAAVAGETQLLNTIGLWALGMTLSAWLVRALSLRRNTTLRPRSTLQSATGIQSAKLVQKSMGMTGGAFNTREFFHGVSLGMMRQAKLAFQVLAFALPAGLMLFALSSDSPTAWTIAAALQLPGLLIERWFFFAQARHPQNLYYQVVS
jgi:DMSO reductase anchor subunit